MGQIHQSQRIKLAVAGMAVATLATGCSIASLGTRAPEPDIAVQEPIIEQPAEPNSPSISLAEPVDESTASETAKSPITTGAPSTKATTAETGSAVSLEPGSSGLSPAGELDSEVTAGDGGNEVAIAPTPDSAASSNRGPSVYWLGDNDNQVEYNAKRIAVVPNADAEAQLRTAMDELLTGSDATAIPPATKLLGAEVRGQDVYVDLSSEFTAGGGSSAMAARLGQVIYTATAVEPGAQVWISVDGEPLTELGGEGLLIEQPLDVAKFEEDFGI